MTSSKINIATERKLAASFSSLIVVVPAAGVGQRMQADCPKQYLSIDGLTILEHTVLRLLDHQHIDKVVIAIGAEDGYFSDTQLANHPNVVTVIGGEERVDSVLAGLAKIDSSQYPWVLVHDAARPCVTHDDIDALIASCLQHNAGGLLAAPVYDTVKKCASESSLEVEGTLDRRALWRALTPQMYRTEELTDAIEQAQINNIIITDESSAIEYAQLPSFLVQGSSDNIKITRPDDLALAAFLLDKQQEKLCE